MRWARPRIAGRFACGVVAGHAVTGLREFPMPPRFRFRPPHLAGWAFVLLAPCAQADDIAPFSDEFDDSATIADWQDLGVVEGWGTPSFETADIDTTEAGRFHIVPGALTWFDHLRGLLFFKEIDGDFIATTRLRVLSRHNPMDPTEPPNRTFSLAGIFAHAPRAITQAAPDPYTTTAVWPPGDFGSDYVPNTENFIFLSYGSAGNAGTRQFEIKSTLNSDSLLYYDSTGIDQGETEVWLQMVRVGDTVVCLRKHSAAGGWIVENRYPNPDHHYPAFGSTLQVGITAYTDWPTASPFSGNVQSAYHFNYAPPGNGQPDLIAQVDYVRFRRPPGALTEAVLQGMSVSYDPAANVTSNPPVLLSASASASPHLGENANLVYDPYGDWRAAQFGASAALPIAEPGEDPDAEPAQHVAVEQQQPHPPPQPAQAPVRVAHVARQVDPRQPAGVDEPVRLVGLRWDRPEGETPRRAHQHAVVAVQVAGVDRVQHLLRRVHHRLLVTQLHLDQARSRQRALKGQLHADLR